MLNKYYGMANIEKCSLSKLANFLNYAYEKEIYQRWLTIYPIMEAGLMEFVSFESYKQKMVQNIKTKIDTKMTDDEIIEEGMQIVQAFERKKQQRQVKASGNI